MNQFIEKHQPTFEQAIEHFKKEIGGIRTGRATPALLENIQVLAYDIQNPITQVASINVSDARSMTVEPWDKTILKDVEKAISSADLGVGATVEGSLVRVTLPQMTEENRQQYLKILKERLERAKVTVRNVREKVKDEIVTALKDKEITEDDKYKFFDELKDKTAEYNKQLDDLAASKEKEITTL